MVDITLALPMTSSFLLGSLLGTVNVTLPHMGDRFKYKTEYEQFKLKGTVVIILGALVHHPPSHTRARALKLPPFRSLSSFRTPS